MELFDKIRNQAKMDSRRFGKSVVCRIVYDKPADPKLGTPAVPLLSIVEKENLAPSGIRFNAETGLDPLNYKMFVIPVSAYPGIEALVKGYQTSPPDNQDPVDFEAIERTTQSRSALVAALQQNLVLITISMDIPHGFQAGLLPQMCDVLIDGTDVNQTIEGTYVYRTKSDIRKKESLDK
jgi:hypothetical protein